MRSSSYATASLLVAAMLLAACASNDVYYQQSNYTTSGQVNPKPFNQVAAECKMNTMSHNKLWDVYELEVPRFKACMEMNGYVYGNDVQAIHTPQGGVPTPYASTNPMR